MLRMHLAHIDHLSGSIAALDDEVERVIAPFADPLRRLLTIPGAGQRTAEVVVAESSDRLGPAARPVAVPDDVDSPTIAKARGIVNCPFTSGRFR